MRVLLVTDRCFLPPTDGASCIYGTWLEALAGLGADVSVLSFDHGRTRWSPEGRAAARRQADLFVVPFVGSRAETAARRAGTYLYRLATGRQHPPAALGRPWRPEGRKALVAALTATRWDAVIVHHMHTVDMIGADLLRRLGCPVTVYLHDSMALRRRLLRASLRRALADRTWPLLRALQPQEVLDALLPGPLAQAVAEDVGVLRGVAHVLFASQEERATYVAAGLDPARCHIHVTAPLTGPLPAPAGTLRAEGGPAPFDIGFIGGVNVFNMEALAFLAREILPRLDRLLGRPATALLGGRSAAAMRDLFAGRPGAVVEPWFKDVADFYGRVAIVAVPMLSGSGVSTKTIEAAGFGAALVTTASGARGVALTRGEDFLLADDPDDFAAAAAALLSDPARRAALGRRARAAFMAEHAQDRFVRQVARLIGAAPPQPGPVRATPADVARRAPAEAVHDA